MNLINNSTNPHIWIWTVQDGELLKFFLIKDKNKRKMTFQKYKLEALQANKGYCFRIKNKTYFRDGVLQHTWSWEELIGGPWDKEVYIEVVNASIEYYRWFDQSLSLENKIKELEAAQLEKQKLLNY